MVTLLEVGLLVLVLGLLFGAYRLVRTIKPFVVNAVVGLLILLIASWLGFAVAITPVAVLIVAVAGAPGAILVLLLSVAGVAFVPALALAV